MGLKDAMMKDAKKDKKGWSWKGKYGWMGSNSKAGREAEDELEKIDNPGNTGNAVASNDYEKE